MATKTLTVTVLNLEDQGLAASLLARVTSHPGTMNWRFIPKTLPKNLTAFGESRALLRNINFIKRARTPKVGFQQEAPGGGTRKSKHRKIARRSFGSLRGVVDYDPREVHLSD